MLPVNRYAVLQASIYSVGLIYSRSSSQCAKGSYRWFLKVSQRAVLNVKYLPFNLTTALAFNRMKGKK